LYKEDFHRDPELVYQLCLAIVMARVASRRKTRWSTADLEPHLVYLNWGRLYTGRDMLGRGLSKMTRANRHLFVRVYSGQQLMGYQLTDLGKAVALGDKYLRAQREVDQMLVIEWGQ